MECSENLLVLDRLSCSLHVKRTLIENVSCDSVVLGMNAREPSQASLKPLEI